MPHRSAASLSSLALAVLVAGSLPARAGYEFSLSASDTDPNIHTASPSGGLRSVYLWLACSDDGIAAFETGVSGTLPVFGFTPLNGVMNAGNATDLLLAVPGCPDSLVLGSFAVWDSGGTLCLAPSGNGWIAAVDCDPVDPEEHADPAVVGFATDGSIPCAVGSNGCVGDGYLLDESGGGSIGSEWEP